MGVIQFVGSGTGGAPASVTFTNPCTAGHSVVVGLIVYGSTHIVQGNITTTQGDTYTLLFTPAGNSAIETQAGFFLCQSVSSGTQTISCSSHTAQAICAWEVDDLSASAFDKSNIGVGTSSSAATAATATLAQAAERVFAIVGTDQGNSDTITQTAGEGWTFSGEDEAGASNQCFNAVHKLVAATTAVSASWALAGSHNWAAAIATFKQSATGNATASVVAATVTVTASNPTYDVTNPYWVKEVGFVTDSSAGTTSALTVATGGVPVGDTIVIYGACDNTGTLGVATTIAVADNSTQAGTANTYTLQTPQAIADPGAASAGQQGFFVVCSVTRALLAADTITVTFGNSTTAKAINAQQFHNVNTTTPVLAGSYARDDNETGQVVSLAASPTKAGQIVCTLVAVEGGTADTFTEDADTTAGAWVTLTRRGSGTTTSGSTLNSAYKITTATTSQSYGTATMLGTGRDHCGAILVLDTASTNATATVVPATVTVTAANAAGSGTATAAVVNALVTVTATNPVASGGASASATVVAATVTVSATNPGGHGAATASAVNALVTVTGTNPVASTARTASVVAALVTVTGTDPVAHGSATATVVAAVVTVTSSNALAYGPGAFAASISGRKILDQRGHVYLMRTFSSWAMASNLSDSEITTALTGVASNGFNAVTVWIGGGANYGAGWHQYTNNAGQNFWTGTPWASSLGAAWASVDWVISEAARLGLTVNASFCGGNGSTGARADWVAVTNANMTTAGAAIATRYLSATNIVWHVMFDSTDTPTDPGGARVEALFSGINSVEGSARPVRWMEPDQGASIDSQGWFGTAQFAIPMNGMYEYGSNSVELVEAAYAERVSPIGDVEPPYDGSPHYSGTIGQQLRERSYAVFVEGGCFINYGQEDWWPFGAAGLYTESLAWTDVQAHSHTVQQSYAWVLLDLYAADPTWAPSALLTGGAGTGDTKAASGSSDTAGLVYFPNTRGSITVDTTLIVGTGNVRLRWYDPTNGTYTSIAASEAQNASRSLTYPASNNSAGETDWVFVLDAVSTAATATVVAATVTVTASNAAGSGAATATVVAAVVTVTASNPVGHGAATASAVAASVVVTAANPVATGTAQASVIAASVAATATNPTASGTAQASVVAALVTVTATNPNATGSATGTANVVNALVAATATNPVASGTGKATVVAATVTVTATNPTVTRLSNANPIAATVDVTATNPATRLTGRASPVGALVDITGTNPSASGTGNATATVVAATVAVSAANPVGHGAAVATVGAATVTASATNPGVTYTATVAVVAALVLVAAYNAEVIRHGHPATSTGGHLAPHSTGGHHDTNSPGGHIAGSSTGEHHE